MPTIVRALMPGLLSSSVAFASTCYVEDMRVLGSSETLINNVVGCASHVSSSGGGITDCMIGLYPSYGLISEECLDCTTEVMESDTGIRCLPECIDHPTSSDCVACVPGLSELFNRNCNQGLVGPRQASVVHSASGDNACTATDVEYMGSAQKFVGLTIGCMDNMAQFQTCIYYNIPRYNDISANCKACMSEQTTFIATRTTVEAEACGALCLQQGVKSADCATCTAGLMTAVDRVCLGNGVFTQSIFAAVVVAIIAILN